MSDPGREVDLVITGGTIVTPGGVRRAGIAVDGGRIVAVTADHLLPPARRRHDATGLHVLPGLVDSEAHPGCYVPLKDDLATESRAAAVAGVTTWGIHAPIDAHGRARLRRVRPGGGRRVLPRRDGWLHRPGRRRLGRRRVPDPDARDRPAGRGDPRVRKDYGVTSYKLYLQSMSPEAEPFWPGRRAGWATASTTA